MHDFPRIKAPYSKPSNFLDTLLRTHTSLGTPSGLYKEALTYFDYSSAEGVRLVLSVPGYQRGARDLGQNGHTGLSKALQELNLATLPDRARLDLECQHSSCGAYTMDWIRSFYRSAMGWDPINAGISSGTSRKKLPVPDKHWPPLKIVYPTLRTVKESLGGVNVRRIVTSHAPRWGERDERVAHCIDRCPLVLQSSYQHPAFAGRRNHLLQPRNMAATEPPSSALL